MTARTAAERGRDAAARLMVDTIVVTRPAAATFDKGTGLLTAATGVTVYEGPARMRPPTSQEAAVMFGEEQLTRSRLVVCVPHDSPGIRIGDVITFTDSGDPDVLSKSYTVTAVTLSSFTIYKGVACEVLE